MRAHEKPTWTGASRRRVLPEGFFELPDQEAARAKLELPDNVRILITTASDKLLHSILANKNLRASKAFRRVVVTDFVESARIPVRDLPQPPRKQTSAREQEPSPASVPHQAFEPDARARAILRAIEQSRRDLAATGGSYSIENVKDLLGGISRQAVDRRVHDRKLLVVPGPRGARRFPVIQFGTNGEPIRGLDRVQDALGYSSPWAVLNFLVNGQPDLGEISPIEAIRSGRLDDVLTLARSAGVAGA